MRTLSLAHNELHSLNQDLFEHLPELAELDLSGNPLVTIDHVTLIAVGSLPLLKVIIITTHYVPSLQAGSNWAGQRLGNYVRYFS